MRRDLDPAIPPPELTGFTTPQAQLPCGRYIGFARALPTFWVCVRAGGYETNYVPSAGEAKVQLRLWGASRIEDNRRKADEPELQLAENAA